ncbi:lipopolysaccharide biosynthesis protein [Parerythrobacter aestuarii]|uniref:lipopolysaccharide biosynthesis protein n=1 Tax=Parerythrobacter aestuarii TaxID=3020909 RepID=UPI0024DEEECB|nr:hypothetical protein [Parerythrobacter aestuarii]
MQQLLNQRLARWMHILRGPAIPLLFGQGLISLVSLIVAVAVSSVFGAAIFGAFSLIAIFANLLLNVLRAALVEPATRIAAMADESARADYLSGLARVILAGFVVLAVPLHFACAALVAFFLKDENLVTPAIATAYVVTFAGAEILRAFFQAFAARTQTVRFDIVRATLTLALLSAVLLQHSGLGDIAPTDAVLGSQAIALMAALGIFGLLNARHLLARRTVPWPLLAQHFRAAGMASSIAFIRTLQNTAPLLIGQLILGEAVLGVVRLWQSVANVVTLPANAMRLNIMAKGAAHLRDGDHGVLAAYVRNISVKMVLLTVAMAAPMAAIILLFPGKYDLARDGFAYMVLFVLYNICANTNASLSSAFYAAGLLRPLLLRVTLALVVVLAISYPVITALGPYGIPAVLALVAFVLVGVNLQMLKHMERT